MDASARKLASHKDFALFCQNARRNFRVILTDRHRTFTRLFLDRGHGQALTRIERYSSHATLVRMRQALLPRSVFGMKILSLCCCVALMLLAACSDPESDDVNTIVIEGKLLPITSVNYRMYYADGRRANWQDLIAATKRVSVVFLGELHTDPVAHHLEYSILRDTLDSDLVLSLEMFESDVQNVLDEYLAGYITEEHLISDARAWERYPEAYSPLIEMAREHQIPVIAANPPRRYVNLVSRQGAVALEALPDSAKQFLPPLPYAEASPAYAAKFERMMQSSREYARSAEGMEGAGAEFALQAQSLWDAGMAYSIASALDRDPDARVLHISGSFHSAQRLGIPEHLERYRPGTSTLVITILPDERFPSFHRNSMQDLGDFIIVTDPTRQPDFDD